MTVSEPAPGLTRYHRNWGRLLVCACIVAVFAGLAWSFLVRTRTYWTQVEVERMLRAELPAEAAPGQAAAWFDRHGIGHSGWLAGRPGARVHAAPGRRASRGGPRRGRRPDHRQDRRRRGRPLPQRAA